MGTDKKAEVSFKGNRRVNQQKLAAELQPQCDFIVCGRVLVGILPDSGVSQSPLS